MMKLTDLRVKIFADGADLDEMKAMYAKPWIKGFTTNPTLMRKAGVADYRGFAREVLRAVPDRPVSFEEFADEFAEMERQALEIASWGPNVNVKIPLTNTRREFSGSLIHRLSHAGVQLNVTAVFTLDQVKAIAANLAEGVPAIVSVFAGRIADTGNDPVPLMREALKALQARPKAELLWASPRELLNVVQADQIGCQIITVTRDILSKLSLLGKDHEDYSLETVEMFHQDAAAARYTIPTRAGVRLTDTQHREQGERREERADHRGRRLRRHPPDAAAARPGLQRRGVRHDVLRVRAAASAAAPADRGRHPRHRAVPGGLLGRRRGHPPSCISNDPSFELDGELSRTINYDCFEPLVLAAKEQGVRRFIYASSSSVYGVSDAPEVTESHPLVPLTLYNKYKGLCEPLLFKHQSPDFVCVTIRPATICGYSPRMRLDLSVNILTNHAVNTGKITVFGGDQLRPNLHIQDMCDLCRLLLEVPDERIAGETFNAGYQNHSIMDIAKIVAQVVQAEFPDKGEIEIVTTPTNDPRSYHINSDKIAARLGFRPKRGIEHAVRDLCRAFKTGRLPQSLTDERYLHVKALKRKRAA